MVNFLTHVNQLIASEEGLSTRGGAKQLILPQDWGGTNRSIYLFFIHIVKKYEVCCCHFFSFLLVVMCSLLPSSYYDRQLPRLVTREPHSETVAASVVASKAGTTMRL